MTPFSSESERDTNVEETTRITGSSPENLGKNADAAVNATMRKNAAKQKVVEVPQLTKAQVEQRVELLKDLCDELVDGSFTIPVIVTGDARWREKLAAEKLAKLSLRWNVFFQAWGIDMAGKVSATIALAMGYAVEFGRINGEIGREDAELAEKGKPNA